ncbi:MAG: 2-hydroxyacid dehydrogenase [Pseudobdellovibrio sp.]
MKLIFFNTQSFEEKSFKDNLVKSNLLKIDFYKENLNSKTAILCKGYEGIISFVNDELNANVLTQLKDYGVKAIFLRSAGYNHVDIKKANELNLPVYRVPAYSPEAVAEHSVALLLTLNRKTHKAYQRVREMNFSLEGLVGYNLKNKTVGIIGAGKIGKAFAKIISGFGCKVLISDPYYDSDFAAKASAEYVSLEQLLNQSDVISIHCPLTPQTHHLINSENIFKLKKGAVLINTSRGAIIETKAVISALKCSHIGGAALDVYEFESELFFADHSSEIIQDDTIARLMSFPNVLITAHQGFLTHEALDEISKITLLNILDFQLNGIKSPSKNKINY